MQKRTPMPKGEAWGWSGWVHTNDICVNQNNEINNIGKVEHLHVLDRPQTWSWMILIFHSGLVREHDIKRPLDYNIVSLLHILLPAWFLVFMIVFVIYCNCHHNKYENYSLVFVIIGNIKLALMAFLCNMDVAAFLLGISVQKPHEMSFSQDKQFDIKTLGFLIVCHLSRKLILNQEKSSYQFIWLWRAIQKEYMIPGTTLCWGVVLDISTPFFWAFRPVIHKISRVVALGPHENLKCKKKNILRIRWRNLKNLRVNNFFVLSSFWLIPGFSKASNNLFSVKCASKLTTGLEKKGWVELPSAWPMV